VNESQLRFPGEFNQGHRIAVDSKGNVYIAGNRGRRIHKFQDGGFKVVAARGEPGTPTRVRAAQLSVRVESSLSQRYTLVPRAAASRFEARRRRHGHYQ
jgi:hypothetical protein